MLVIGGELEFDPQAYFGELRNSLAAWNFSAWGVWTDLGRSALLLAALAIRERGGRRVWLPAFSCASVAQPFAQAGFALNYYCIGVGLMGVQSPTLLPEAGDTVLFIHYFGHRNEQMIQLTSSLKAAGVWVIEDCVQASLRPTLSEHADFAVTSYRKFLPVADGALLLSHEPVSSIGAGMQLSAPDESFVGARLIAKILRGAAAHSSDFLPLLERTETAVDRSFVARRMSFTSTWMLERIDLEEVARKRRINWLALYEGIRERGLESLLEPVTPGLGAEVVPLGFPVRVAGERRDELRGFLAQRQIYCPVHWPLNHLPREGTYAYERDLERSCLTLPIDQRVTPAHVERLLTELMGFFHNSRF